MKPVITTFTAVSCAFGVMAQSLPNDSLPVHELHEVVIKAPKVIRKADMDVYHPSESAVEYSRNGLQLLNNLMIPTLTVNDMQGSITASGQAVQVRINGRESTIEQVQSLLPETIKRVEWIDNPGLRYGGANYVLNFIVANPTTGGSLMAMASPVLTDAFGRYKADVKFNHGRSQWNVAANFKLTEDFTGHRDYYEKFTYPDGSSLTRTEKPIGGRMDNTQGMAWASYNYIKPDTTTFIAEFKWYRNFDSRIQYDGLMSLSNGADDIRLTDVQGESGDTPSLSLYWEQHFKGRQSLVVNFGASFFAGRTYSDYMEQLPDAADYLTDIHTSIKDRNQAYAIEADYIKKWQNGRLTAGASYTANRNRSLYEDLDGEVFHQRQDKVYLFAEYFHRFGNWTVTAGMGMQYNDFMFKESKNGNSSWNPRPQATITYSLNQNHKFRLSFNSWQLTPSLAETNAVPQQLDGFQWRIGNPNLNTADNYKLALRYGFNFPRVNGVFDVIAFSSPNAIEPLLYWDDDKLITTYENSSGTKSLIFSLSPQIEIIPEWLIASGNVRFQMDRTRGTGYKHSNNSFSGSARLQLRHWGFTLNVAYSRAVRDLTGETVSWGEDFSEISLNYNWKKWQFGAGWMMPFGRYDQGSKSLNQWNSNEKHMRVDISMPYISVAYNLQWGRQKSDAEKLVDVDVSVDRSTAGGR